MKIWRKQFLEKTQSSVLRLALSVTIDIDIDIEIAYRSLLSIQLADILGMKEPGEQRHPPMACNLPRFLVHPRDRLRPRDHRTQQVNIGAGFGRPGLRSVIADPMALLTILEPRPRPAAGAGKSGPQIEPPYSRLIHLRSHCDQPAMMQ